MIPRARHLEKVQAKLESNPVVALLGTRQVGKTTLARQLAAASDLSATFFDLEDPIDLAQLDDPMLALAEQRGLIVIDEIQRRPDLFPVLRVLVDREDQPARFLVLGSVSPDLLRQTSESLAGRISYYELPPLALDEVGSEAVDRLWFRGGFPRSFLAASDDASLAWLDDFVRTFLERDLPGFGFRVAPSMLERFWSMLAHVHGGIWNAAELARALGVSAGTVRHYLDILTSTFVVRAMQPWHENLGKRQVKAPKIYLRDSGLLHSLLRVSSREELLRHPKLGLSWEGFALDMIVARLGVDRRDCYFWRTHTGAELDLLVVARGRRLGFELKRASAPTTRKSMYTVLEDLRLDRLDVVHAGPKTYPLRERIRAVALARLWEDLEPLVP